MGEALRACVGQIKLDITLHAFQLEIGDLEGVEHQRSVHMLAIWNGVDPPAPMDIGVIVEGLVNRAILASYF